MRGQWPRARQLPKESAVFLDHVAYFAPAAAVLEDCGLRLTPPAWRLQQRLMRHVGLNLAAFSHTDAERDRCRAAAAGFPVEPLVDMRRPVATGNGGENARFTIARIAPRVMPEGRVQFLPHHSESLVWRDPYLDHANGAQALLALWIATSIPFIDNGIRRQTGPGSCDVGRRLLITTYRARLGDNT